MNDAPETGGPTPRDGRRRQVVVVASVVVALAVATIGSGALGGTPIAEAAGGALSADATPLAPAVPAFAIWSVIYTGLVALAVWQALPSRRQDPRVDPLRPALAASALLNAVWVLVVQAGWLGASVAVILVLLGVLAWVFVYTTRVRPRGWVEALVLDGTTGLYLGWVTVATVANTTAWLAARGLGDRAGRGLAGTSEIAAVVVLAVVGLVGALLAHVGRGRISVALAIVWGLAWVVVARITGDLVSAPAAIAAATAAGATIAVTVAARPSRVERAAA